MPILALGVVMRLSIGNGEKSYELHKSLPAGILQEAKKYVICLEEDNAEDLSPEDYSVTVSGVPANLIMTNKNNGNLCLKWIWEPEFFSGQFYPEVFYQGKRIWPEANRSIAIIVNPDQAKLSEEHFCLMLEEVSRIAFLLSPAYKQARLGHSIQRLSIAQLEMITLYIKDILCAVERIAQNPKKKLLRIRHEVPVYQVRQTDEETLLRMVTQTSGWSKTNNAELSPGLSEIAMKMNGHLVERVSEVSNRVSYDTYENAFVKGFLLRLLYFTYMLDQQLGYLEKNRTVNDPIRYYVAANRRWQIRSYRKSIQSKLNMPFLREVNPLTTVGKVTVTMQKHPDYRRLYTYYHKLLRNITPLGGECFDISIERTYQLYEYWCYLKLIERLVQKYGVSKFDGQEVFKTSAEDKGLSLKLTHGKQSMVKINERIRIYFQRQYDYYNKSRYGSYSGQMKPDIVIEQIDDKGILRTTILDPKYRVTHTGIREALVKMHAYKDAIVDKNMNRIVEKAYILVPDMPTDTGDSKYVKEQYKKDHGLGILIVSPGNDAGFDELLQSILL